MPIAAWNNLASGEGEPDWNSLAGEFRDCKRTFIPHVASWQAYQPITRLNWRFVKYDSSSNAPTQRGVYAFVLCPVTILSTSVPPFGFIFYVGETGDHGNESLRTRLRSYRNKRQQRSRARIYSMIDLWSEHLYFYYAVVRSAVSTKEVEKLLLDALLPPCNEKDFSARVSNARKAALN